MLRVCGLETLGDLYSDLPDNVKLKGGYDIPSAMGELELRRHIDGLCSKNKQLVCFAGGGVYDHYTPAVIPSLVARSEFRTSYTPYQAEISQGTLHYIFEFQSMMAELTGMDVSNACMYDGATATAEAVMMADANSKKSNRVLVSETIDPKVMEVVKTYARFRGVEIVSVAAEDGVTSRKDLADKLAGGAAGVVVQQPNYYGVVEDFTGLAEECHAAKALLVINSVAADLALLKTPAEWGADIAVGECQSLGIPMSYGGPYVGYMCCTEKLIRKLPGRIVGKTLDKNGQRAFVLTLQAREQHIRRQKATSNICSNESLMALFATIYMSIMGKEGVKEAAQASYDGAHYLHSRLMETGLFKPTFNHPFFNEFCVDYRGDAAKLHKRLGEAGFLAGLLVGGNTIMFAVTEKRTKEEIDQLVALCHE